MGVLLAAAGVAGVQAAPKAPRLPPADADTCRGGHDGILVRVHDVRNAQGQVVAVLYGDKPDDFLKSKRRLARSVAPAHPGTVSVCLPSRGSGTYAIAVFHDEDSDLHLGRNFVGLPTEGWGISNNPRIQLRKPEFQEAAFRAGAGLFTIDVRLSY